jgi:hypothetical protein
MHKTLARKLIAMESTFIYAHLTLCNVQEVNSHQFFLLEALREAVEPALFEAQTSPQLSSPPPAVLLAYYMLYVAYSLPSEKIPLIHNSALLSHKSVYQAGKCC